MTPLLVLAEFGCSEAGEAELRPHLERTLCEARDVEGSFCEFAMGDDHDRARKCGAELARYEVSGAGSAK